MTKEKYVINKDTSVIFSHFDNRGFEHSAIMKSNGEEVHDQNSPTEIVDYSFKYKAKGLQGAIDGARFILNKKHDVPVIYSLSDKIILFRFKTPDGRGSIWLVDSQIHRMEPYLSNQTKVYLLNGKSIIVGTKHHLLVNKRKDCSYLLSEAMKNEKFPNEQKSEVQMDISLVNLLTKKYGGLSNGIKDLVFPDNNAFG